MWKVEANKENWTRICKRASKNKNLIRSLILSVIYSEHIFHRVSSVHWQCNVLMFSHISTWVKENSRMLHDVIMTYFKVKFKQYIWIWRHYDVLQHSLRNFIEKNSEEKVPQARFQFFWASCRINKKKFHKRISV